MQPLCWGHLRAGWADRMLQTDFLRPDAMPIRPEQTLFLLMMPPTYLSPDHPPAEAGGAQGCLLPS